MADPPPGRTAPHAGFEQDDIINVEALRRDFDGDRESLRIMVAKFIQRTPLRLTEIQAAVASGGELRPHAASAHDLAGLFSMFKAPRSRAAVLRLEGALAIGDREAAIEALAAVDRELARVVAVLNALVREP